MPMTMTTKTADEAPPAEKKDTSTTLKDSETEADDVDTDILSEQVSKLQLSSQDTSLPLIICDAGYGLPSQARPRKEKILAISKQLYNFLYWQAYQKNKQPLARVKVVGSSETIKCLQDRLVQLWDTDSLPSHVEFVSTELQTVLDDYDEQAVYLSPDATNTLDPSKRPPRVVIVGLLIDRRIQPNRSRNRASSLEIQTEKWPLEECFANISENEPLNVDTIMEGMQEWHWNCSNETTKDGTKECFVQAATSAIERHAQRHPNRPLHKTTCRYVYIDRRG
jgi:hypothetical protein